MDLHRSSGRLYDSDGSHGSTNDIWTESSFEDGPEWRASQDDDRSLAFDGGEQEELDADEAADELADENDAGANDEEVEDEAGSGLDCFAYF